MSHKKQRNTIFDRLDQYLIAMKTQSLTSLTPLLLQYSIIISALYFFFACQFLLFFRNSFLATVDFLFSFLVWLPFLGTKFKFLEEKKAPEFLLAISLVGIIAAVPATGYSRSPALIWLVYGPILSGMITHTKRVFLWSLICLGAFLLTALAGFYLPPIEPLSPAANGLIFHSVIVATILLSTYATIINNLRHRNLQERIIKDNNTLSRYLRVISHDVATPLTLVKNLSELGKEEKISADYLPKVWDKIYHSAQMINEILQEVREKEAVRLGKAKVTLVPCNINNILTQLLLIFNDRLQEKNIQIINEIPQDTLVIADPITLKNQVLNNVLSNAIKFSYKNRSVYFTLENKAQGGCVLSIKDEGVGLDLESTDQLFNPAKSVSTQGTSGEKGSGFGMPIVNDYMSLFGGFVSVHSVGIKGQGTTVRLHFKKP